MNVRCVIIIVSAVRCIMWYYNSLFQRWCRAGASGPAGPVLAGPIFAEKWACPTHGRTYPRWLIEVNVNLLKLAGSFPSSLLRLCGVCVRACGRACVRVRAGVLVSCPRSQFEEGLVASCIYNGLF